MRHRNIAALTLMLPVLAHGACATRVTETPSTVDAAARPFGGFERVLLVNAELAEPYRGQVNERAVRRIGLVRAQQVGPVLNDVEVYSPREVDRMNFTGTRSLLIRPLIKQIKFLNVGARITAGPAGGSGEVLANPGYFRKAGAWSFMFSSADNRMLTAVAEDVASDTRRYRCRPGERWVRLEQEDSEAGDTATDSAEWRPISHRCEG